MWAWWAEQFQETKCGFGNECRVMAWIRQQDLVPYIGSFCRTTLRTEVQNRLWGGFFAKNAPCSVDFSLRLLLCSALGSSFPRLLPDSWEISRTSPLCGFRSKRQRDPLTGSHPHPHPHNECPTSYYTTIESWKGKRKRKRKKTLKFPPYQWSTKENMQLYIDLLTSIEWNAIKWYA